MGITSPVMVPQQVAASNSRRVLRSVTSLMAYQGFTMAINRTASPWIAVAFNLNQSGIARLFAWIALSSIGALILSGMADRWGRRRILILCSVATPACALTAALSAEIRSFAIFEILLYSFAAATVSGAMVMLAEEMSVDRRALGQSLGGLAASLGGGVCVGIIPILAAHNLSWRWLLALSAGGIFVLPAMACSIPESHRWEEANTRRPPLRIGYWEVFQAKYHRRSIPSLVSALLTSIAATAAMSWPYYHAVAVVGLSAGAATAIVLICGGAAMAGFTAGAWAAEEFGRVQTVLVFGIMAAIGGFAFYWGPPASFAVQAVWLGTTYLWSSFCRNAMQVAGNSAATELFPTSVRSTMAGWYALIGAIGAVTSQALIAALARPLGGLSFVAGLLSLLGIPSAIVFKAFIPETRGLSLEDASLEEVPPRQA